MNCCWTLLNDTDTARHLLNATHQLVNGTHGCAHYTLHSNCYIATAADCLATAAKTSCGVGRHGVLEMTQFLFKMPFFKMLLRSMWNCLMELFASLSPTDIRSIPDVAMTGNCTNECSELGHSDACWMPGHPSPVRKTRNPPKLSTFVPYQERGSLGRLANGSARLGGEEHRSRLPPSRSAYSNSGHDTSQDCPLEEMPLSVPSEFPPTSPTVHTPKREIYL